MPDCVNCITEIWQVNPNGRPGASFRSGTALGGISLLALWLIESDPDFEHAVPTRLQCSCGRLRSVTFDQRDRGIHLTERRPDLVPAETHEAFLG